MRLDALIHTPVVYQQLITHLSSVDLKQVQGSILAASFERFLEQATTMQGRYAGDFYTPASVSQLLASLLAANHGGTIYDPACGTASMLLSAYQKVSAGGKLAEVTQLFGQERNSQTAALAKINIFLHGLSTTSIKVGDTLLDPRFQDLHAIQTFDYVISNPPMSLENYARERLEKDPFSRFPWGIASTNLDFAFIQHILASLNPNGRAVLLVSPGVLSRSGREDEMRRKLVEADLVEAVISLPPNILPGTAIPPIILILNKSKPQAMRKRVLFVRNDNTDERNRLRNVISEAQQARIVQAVRECREESRFSVIASITQIEAQDYVLTPTKYVALFDSNRFLGGSAQWDKLSLLANIIEGTNFRWNNYREGTTPVIRARDLSGSNIRVDELTRIDIEQNTSKYITTEIGDILLQRNGYRFRAHLIEEELHGVFIDRSVYIIRLNQKYIHIARYIVEFFNSDIGQSLISATVRGFGVPTIRIGELRNLSIPVPDRLVVELINNLYSTEAQFIDRVEKTRNIRHRLFTIEDAERVNVELRNLSTEAHILSTSLVQADRLEFQIRNFYPFPLAFSYRTLDPLHEPIGRYREQLRVAENILAFLGSIGLMLSDYTNLLRGNTQKLTRDLLKGYWEGGISPGDWQDLGRRTGNILRENRDLAITQGFSSLWVKDGSKKESAFAADTKRLVQRKNDFKHDRWPTTQHEYSEANKEISGYLQQIMGPLAFLIQHPIRLVLDVRIERKTGEALLDTLLYMGDHQGMRQERVSLSASLPQDDLYLEITSRNWAPLYPLLSVHYCPDCKTRETYLIDKWDGSGKTITLKSFERGHTLDAGESVQRLSDDFGDWLDSKFP